MTERLYYTDSTSTTFDGTVVAIEEIDGRPAAVLDRTLFYPTSGGQPFDLGTLGDVPVLDVIDREDGTIAHVTASPLAVGTRVRGAIDWARRLDHMQQHTGQHILSAAFDQLFGVRTVSFHMGAEVSTIDLAREVTPKEIAAAEALASSVVFEDRPVDVKFASDEEAAKLPLRKESARTGTLRLVDVSHFDLSACGGTHVPRTGVIGLIAVSHWERFKGGSRVGFVCGGRALALFGRQRDVIAEATRVLSVPSNELAATIERQRGELKDTGRAIRQLQEEVAAHRAAAMRADAETIGGLRGVLKEVPGWDAAALKTLAQAIVSEPGYVAILVGSGQPAPVVAARASDVVFHAGAWIGQATTTLGGRGGGRPELAQGGIPAAAPDILAIARRALDTQPRD